MRLIYPLILILTTGCSTVLKNNQDCGLKPYQVIITIDDGPNYRPGTTDAILDVLKKHQVRAVFNLIGRNLPEQDVLLRKMYTEGHLLSYHTTEHDLVSFSGRQALNRDYDLFTNALPADLAGTITGYRPPVGIFNNEAESWAAEKNLKIIPASYMPWDPNTSHSGAQNELKNILDWITSHQGGIITLHDGAEAPGFRSEADFFSPEHPADRRWVAPVLDEAISALKKAGYTFVIPSD